MVCEVAVLPELVVTVTVTFKPCERPVGSVQAVYFTSIALALCQSPCQLQ